MVRGWNYPGYLNPNVKGNMKLLQLLNYQLAIKFLCRFVIIYKIYNGKNYWKKNMVATR